MIMTPRKEYATVRRKASYSDSPAIVSGQSQHTYSTQSIPHWLQGNKVTNNIDKSL